MEIFVFFCAVQTNMPPIMQKELEKYGVPAWADTHNGFFRTVEVAVMLSLLRVIDNPLQDISFASVLMSPIYGFTVDDMAQMRGNERKQPLYLACKSFGNQNRQAAAFLEDLEQYRTMAATMPADRLLNYIYQKKRISEYGTNHDPWGKQIGQFTDVNGICQTV